ncbi:hypothetical protein [Phaeospirillum tilakii]|jgi:lysozyme family protein|uniref:Uncharacterized protein n=1 Tax=Phaeospirillum tilakii TaxID=741673 RepID=A0ABW5CCK0_9PROT
MGGVVRGIAGFSRVTAKAMRWLTLMLLKLSRWIVRLTGRGTLAFARSSSEIKTSTVTALAVGAGGIVLSPLVEISVLGTPVSSALCLAVLGLVLGGLAGYAAVKKVRGVVAKAPSNS